MAKVKMLKEALGSPDGLHICKYKSGNTYDIPIELAKVFLYQMRVAEVPRELDPVKVEVKVNEEKKSLEGPKENKMMESPKENKETKSKHPNRKKWTRK